MVLISAGFMWGFTVDDALISVRYARNLADGGLYRFDPSVANTDGVTPLPWPFLLALFARHSDALDVLVRAKAMGLVFGTLTGARVGWALSGTAAPRWGKWLATVALAVCLPLAAHTVSGMETALVTLLATLAATEPGARWRAAFAGLSAAFRPELLPWALALVAFSGPGQGTLAERWRREGIVRAAVLFGITMGPFIACVGLRMWAFGHPVPLAVAAKPSDASHGLAYAGAAFVVAVGPLAAFVPLAAARRAVRDGGLGPAVVLAAGMHAVSVVFVGGDWMPYARLVVPIAPGLLFAACDVETRASSLGARLVSSVAVGVVVFFGAGLRGRDVMRDRTALVVRARPELASAKVVAALDIGWVSAATSARIVDLAGLTDPEIAALRGGHTSKAIAPRVLLDREVDVLLVYASKGGELALAGHPEQALGLRAVEMRLLSSEIVQRRFRVTAFLPLGTQGAGYLVVRRVPEVLETTP